MSNLKTETIINKAKKLYGLDGFDFSKISAHDGGRNVVFVCSTDGIDNYVLRVSYLNDRTNEDFLAETEFVHYLAANGAPVADIVFSVNGRSIETVEINGEMAYLCLFEYARGILLSDNSYRYRDGAPLEEYFFNTGKTLGKIHRLSKEFVPEHRRADYFDKYNTEYISALIPNGYEKLKTAVVKRLELFADIPRNNDVYGLVHFDFFDGNYHINMETGKITVFDFDNCIKCWYMFDLASLWINGTGWCQFEKDPQKRRAFMDAYFSEVIRGYRTETGVTKEMLSKLPDFIDMVLIENITDAFECSKRKGGETLDYENIEDVAEALINNCPYAGFYE